VNVIDVNQLTKVYQSRMMKGGIVALDNVSLSVAHGEIFGLLGPNGAGKTTLFKVVLGLTRISAGEAYVHGLSPNNPQSRAHIGYLPENHRFPFYLTGLGLIELSGRMHGMSQSQIDERADHLLELVGMDRWASSPLRKYSKGMIQRIGIAQALIADPDLILLDEPTDGVDPVGKVEIREVLKKLRDQGKTIFLNSHLLSEVESVADRVAILQRGKLAALSSVEELTSRKLQYEIHASFGNQLIDVPEAIGRKLTISSKKLIIELAEQDRLNDLIDLIRMKRISIQSIQPMKVSLEQSFIELVTAKEETEAEQ